MNILVAGSGWGLARALDIQVLLENTASHLNQFLRSPFSGDIVVVPSPCNEPFPMVHFRLNAQDPFSIQLSARDRNWSQFSYQFVSKLSDYVRLSAERKCHPL